MIVDDYSKLWPTVKSVRVSVTYTQITKASRPVMMAQEWTKESSHSPMLLNHIGSHRHVCVRRLARHQTLPVGHIPTSGRQKEQWSTPRGRCSSHNLGCMCVQWNKGCLLFTCKLNCTLLMKHLKSYVREVASSGCHAVPSTGEW